MLIDVRKHTEHEHAAAAGRGKRRLSARDAKYLLRRVADWFLVFVEE